MSSGSSRAASAVEPTRSQNSTVSCRRSASRGGAPEVPASPRPAVSVGRLAQSGDRLEQLFAVAERNAELPQILIVEVREDLTVDRVLGKYRDILGQPDLAQPCCYFMRRTHPTAPLCQNCGSLRPSWPAVQGRRLGPASIISPVEPSQRSERTGGRGRPSRMRSEKSGSWSAACALVVDQALRLQLGKRHAGVEAAELVGVFGKVAAQQHPPVERQLAREVPDQIPHVGRAVGGERIVELRPLFQLVDLGDILQEQAPGVLGSCARPIEVDLLLAVAGSRCAPGSGRARRRPRRSARSV